MPDGGNLPVVLFTAHGNETSDAYAKMLGAYTLLRKPVNPAVILNTIHRAIEERASQDPAV
jgi:FixJ family two-component response regulator